MYKIRIIYTKTKEAMYIPIADMSDVFLRSFVMNDICVCIDKNNKPCISVCKTDDLMIESIYEIVEVTIKESIDITFCIKSLNESLPLGIVVLSVEYVDIDEKDINEMVESVNFEIIPKFTFKKYATNREITDTMKRYRETMEEYMSRENIDVIIKSEDRSERIDIKPYILWYKMQINNALQVAILKSKEFWCTPKYIMDGFNQYTLENYPYTLKRIKIQIKRNGDKHDTTNFRITKI